MVPLANAGLRIFLGSYLMLEGAGSGDTATPWVAVGRFRGVLLIAVAIPAAGGDSRKRFCRPSNTASEYGGGVLTRAIPLKAQGAG